MKCVICGKENPLDCMTWTHPTTGANISFCTEHLLSLEEAKKNIDKIVEAAYTTKVFIKTVRDDLKAKAKTSDFWKVKKIG